MKYTLSRTMRKKHSLIKLTKLIKPCSFTYYRKYLALERS